MLTATAPTTGETFVRLDLPTVRAGLETLSAEAAKGMDLSEEQQYWFGRYLTAWDYYKPCQPEQYQLEVEEAIAVILGYPAAA